MSVWDDRIRNHQIWGEMERLGESIDRAEKTDTITAESRQALERLRAVLALCGKRLGGSDPLTVVPDSLNVTSEFTNARNSVDAFISDGNPSHLTDANSNADVLILQLHRIPGVSSPEELIDLVRLVQRYRAEIDSAAVNWQETTQKLKAQMVEFDTTVKGLHTFVETTVTTLSSQLDAEKAKISSQAAEFQKSFTEAQENRSSTYTETLRKIQETLSATLSEQQGSFQRLRKIGVCSSTLQRRRCRTGFRS
jgi:hypothetical protein